MNRVYRNSAITQTCRREPSYYTHRRLKGTRLPYLLWNICRRAVVDKVVSMRSGGRPRVGSNPTTSRLDLENAISLANRGPPSPKGHLCMRWSNAGANLTALLAEVLVKRKDLAYTDMCQCSKQCQNDDDFQALVHDIDDDDDYDDA
ncbi:hypothetical protein E2C01_022553 [Portunus trituberculatus]|uniref:Uncharacterized protein n=1 Tax=Portunus trituberculatus TaxID=210409 RepID=A0A5B7E7L1_PORTR|nr:hypothetical protein [Portunus trituberculatus]